MKISWKNLVIYIPHILIWSFLIHRELGLPYPEAESLFDNLFLTLALGIFYNSGFWLIIVIYVLYLVFLHTQAFLWFRKTKNKFIRLIPFLIIILPFIFIFTFDFFTSIYNRSQSKYITEINNSLDISLIDYKVNYEEESISFKLKLDNFSTRHTNYIISVDFVDLIEDIDINSYKGLSLGDHINDYILLEKQNTDWTVSFTNEDDLDEGRMLKYQDNILESSINYRVARIQKEPHNFKLIVRVFAPYNAKTCVSGRENCLNLFYKYFNIDFKM